jgi:Lsr2
MARTVEVVVNDDPDASPDTHTFRSGVDGVPYEIDLAQKNRPGWIRSFGPYIEHARPVSRTHRRTGAGRPVSGTRGFSCGAIAEDFLRTLGLLS